MTTSSSATDEHALLQSARSGSHSAFRSLVVPYEAELRRHCYRMTGSVDDADDLVQETLFRAWRGLGTYAGRASFRAWLYKIATNSTLDLVKSAPRRYELINSAHEPPWLQPYPGGDEVDSTVAEFEAIGLAYIAALQNPPSRQRAALILRDVLGYSAAETADIMSGSVAAANSALQRARSTMTALHPLDPTASSPTNHQRQLADQFLDAWKAADTDKLVSLLSESVHMTMPPHALEVFGALAVAEFLLDVAPDRDPTLIRFESINANNQAGLAMFVKVADQDLFRRHCLMFFAANGEAITKITGFTEDRVFDLLDLPRCLNDDPA